VYSTVEAIWKDDHLEPLEDIKKGKNIRYLITVIEESDLHPVVHKKDFGFEKAQVVLKHYKGTLSDVVIEERRQQR